MAELILFDLDGTLVDSAPDLCTALGQALTEVGLEAHDVGAVRKMIGEGQRVLCERAVRRAGGDPSQVDDVLFRFRRYYSEHLVVKTALYPTVRETIAELSQKVPLVVATNKPGNWARRIIETFALTSHFRFVLGEDDVGARKPDPRLLQTLCERCGVMPASALMVGDSAIDRAAAAACGMPLALCTYGFGDDETIAEAKRGGPPATIGSPERPYLIENLAELLAIL